MKAGTGSEATNRRHAMTDGNTHEAHLSQKTRRLAAKYDLVARKSRKETDEHRLYRRTLKKRSNS